MSFLGWILVLVVAALCALVAQAVVPGSIPGGFVMTMTLGAVGTWVGVEMMGPVGPIVVGVALLPAILGSALLVFGSALLSEFLGGYA